MLKVQCLAHVFRTFPQPLAVMLCDLIFMLFYFRVTAIFRKLHANLTLRNPKITFKIGSIHIFIYKANDLSLRYFLGCQFIIIETWNELEIIIIVLVLKPFEIWTNYSIRRRNVFRFNMFFAPRVICRTHELMSNAKRQSTIHFN